jgi:hypothetical protein
VGTQVPFTSFTAHLEKTKTYCRIAQMLTNNINITTLVLLINHKLTYYFFVHLMLHHIQGAGVAHTVVSDCRLDDWCVIPN